MAQSKEFLINRHKELHSSLDQLVACYIDQTYIYGKDHKDLSNTSVMELLKWSHQQTINPSCFKQDPQENVLS